MITWERIDGGAFVARLPGLIILARPSHFRYACSRRWGWAISDETDQPIAKSRITRHSRHGLAMAGAIRWVKQYRPEVWQAAMEAAGDADG